MGAGTLTAPFTKAKSLETPCFVSFTTTMSYDCVLAAVNTKKHNSLFRHIISLSCGVSCSLDNFLEEKKIKVSGYVVGWHWHRNDGMAT